MTSPMQCSFSGQKIPGDKLFVLYYPPSMAHQNWSKSVYAATRAREAIAATVDELQNFYSRYVVGKGFYTHLAIGLVGFLLLGYWAYVLVSGWSQAGFVSAFVAPFAGLMLVLFARSRFRAYSERRAVWEEKGSEKAAGEIAAIQEISAKIAEDPSAEAAAPILRRECPESLSEIAFQGQNFRAFTYLDFILFPKLKNPTSKEELPAQHSLHRDAYYVGDIVFDSWRTFHRDRRDVVDPRFAGSGGRRGVI